ncbi:hypothetical protein HK098_007826, partial [Nowakowskiella sp. JEL0407]
MRSFVKFLSFYALSLSQVAFLPILFCLISNNTFTIPSFALFDGAAIKSTNLSSESITAATIYSETSTPQQKPITRYFEENVEERFGIRYIHDTQFHPEVKDMLSKYNVKEDRFYEAVSSLPTTPLLRDFIDGKIPTKRRLYTKFVSEDKGFGCFSDLPIKKGEPVVLYAGLVTKNPTSDYSWWYPSQFYDPEFGRYMELGVDSHKVGNMARF